MNLSTSLIPKERNTGIDLLRIVSMFFVLVLHSLGQGGILWNAAIASSQYKTAWFLEICAFGAVDIFALISGYVSYTGKEKKFCFPSYFSLWLQTVFYGLLTVTVFHIADPSTVLFSDYKHAFMPVMKNLYWYFTAYTGLFFLMPVLNTAILHSRESALRKTALLIFILFSVYGTMASGFILNGGYSVIWIVLLYILGAAIRKCNIGKRMKPYQAGIGILFLYLFTYLYKIYGLNIWVFTKDTFVDYTSPTVLGAAILYVIAFSKLRFSPALKKCIRFAAPGAFAAYLLNNHPLFWKYVMKDLFRSLTERSPLLIVAYVIGFSALFVIGSILVDRVRIRIFEICRIKALGDMLGKRLNRLLTKIAEWVS